MKYSKERKQAVLAKLSPPPNRPVAEVAAEEGICEGTLYLWRRQARARGELYPNAVNGRRRLECPATRQRQQRP